MMESSEFDATLGGSENLPPAVNSLKFAASRSIEISALTECVTRPSNTKLIFQNLPVHMRRRVMSHNCKRLPRRLRTGHLNQLKKSGLPPKQKRPSRKYRRRPTNLLEEYTRRQRKNKWLETHIWHAKRFHMIERWGYRLANSPCDKAFRACYRASSAHCLMQDISYFVPIQIKGEIDVIKDMFSYVTSNSCGLSIGAKAYINGNREGTINLYMPNAYPYGFIGAINYLWVPTASMKVLWIFVHPSQATQVESILLALKNGYHKVQSNSDELIKRRKIMNKYANVEIKVIVGINRFRLTGPRSHAILVQTLKAVSNIEKVKHNKWVLEAIDKKLSTFVAEKYMYWSNMVSVGAPSQLPPKIVIGLIVKDPRLSRPSKRTKALPDEGSSPNTDFLTNIPSYLSVSPLWDAQILDTIKNNKVTNSQFIDHITKTQVVPGEILEDDPKLQCLPVVLIQRCGSQISDYKKLGYGSGWDIIIPPGYSLPFWLTFVMFGARTGGLRETESLTFEMGENYFAPDCEAGKSEEKRVESELKEKYFSRPPSKRVNFLKLSVPSPFVCPWQILLNDWSNKQEDSFFVLRDKNIINELQICLKEKKKLSEIPSMSCLIGVYLQVGKGNVSKHATICMPDLSDIKCNKTILEPHHEDNNAKLRKQKRLEHRKVLKKVKRKNNKTKKKGILKNAVENGKLGKKFKKSPSDYVKSMRELWLPTEIKTVRYKGIRETMGYIVHGAFSFLEAKSCGVGYITFSALQHLLDKGMNKVLVRNTTSRCYRVANIEIIKSTY